MSNLMNQNHFVFIIGTRAQLIKVAPVIVACEQRNHSCTLLMTGQHLETMQDLLDEFGVKTEQVLATPAKERATVYSLISWIPSAYLGILRQLKALKLVSKQLKVLVHGDTLSTLLGALAGRQIGAAVIHLESGLTSKKLFDPFPEELFRRIVFRLSNIAMCPDSETALHISKNYPKCQPVDTGGNTILDSIKLTGINRPRPEAVSESDQAYIVASLHRFQNIYDNTRLTELVNLLVRVSQTHSVYFVLHPATRKRLTKTGLMKHLDEAEKIILLPRLGYSKFLRLAAESACVLTDGGSNQEELAALGVPTIIMRQATERNDGLGKNAVMERDLPCNTLSYIIERRYKTLESTPTLSNTESPSTRIIDHLTMAES